MENANPREQLTDIEIRMVYNLEGRWFGGVSRYEGVIGPSQTGGMTWDFPDGQPVHGTVEVIGQYSSTPDLGYVKTDFSTQPGKEEIDPEVLATWQGVWTLSGTDRIGPKAGNTSDLGFMEITVEGTRAWFTLRKGPNTLPMLPMRVVENGTCVEFDWDDIGFSATGRMCMGPDRNSYTGALQGSYMNGDARVNADLFGHRIREDED